MRIEIASYAYLVEMLALLTLRNLSKTFFSGSEGIGDDTDDNT